MAQHFEKPTLSTQQIKRAGVIRPKDDKTIYGTGKAKNLPADGKPHIVHAVLAKKLVSAGKASYEAPKAETTNQKGGQQ